jgi:hypothetical protein
VILITAFQPIYFLYLICIQPVPSAQSKPGETLGRRATGLKDSIVLCPPSRQRLNPVTAFLFNSEKED